MTIFCMQCLKYFNFYLLSETYEYKLCEPIYGMRIWEYANWKVIVQFWNLNKRSCIYFIVNGICPRDLRTKKVQKFLVNSELYEHKNSIRSQKHHCIHTYFLEISNFRKLKKIKKC